MMRAILRLTALMMLLCLALAPGSGASALITPANIIAEDLADTAEWVVTGDDNGGLYGYDVSAGDFDGDGDDDVLIGAPKSFSDDSDSEREGAVFLYAGDWGGLQSFPSWSRQIFQRKRLALTQDARCLEPYLKPSGEEIFDERKTGQYP